MRLLPFIKLEIRAMDLYTAWEGECNYFTPLWWVLHHERPAEKEVAKAICYNNKPFLLSWKWTSRPYTFTAAAAATGTWSSCRAAAVAASTSPVPSSCLLGAEYGLHVKSYIKPETRAMGRGISFLHPALVSAAGVNCKEKSTLGCMLEHYSPEWQAARDSPNNKLRESYPQKSRSHRIPIDLNVSYKVYARYKLGVVGGRSVFVRNWYHSSM